MKTPLVSIICITYNQEDYIRKTLDSFLMQKTDFNFEILIHDDASTDNTEKIIKEYATKHPDIFRTFFEKENQYSKNNVTFVESMYKSAQGKYIAWCEGDDYWTDPKKLQIQVDFLEKNLDYSICFHLVEVFFENNEEKPYTYPDINKVKEFTTKELLRGNFIQTNSVMYRVQKNIKIPEGIMPQDWYVHLYFAQFGKIGCINKVMADYRRTPGGVWWGSYRDKDKIWAKYGIQHINLYLKMIDLYKDNVEYRETIYNSLSMLLTQILESDKRNNTHIVADALEKYAKEITEILIDENNINFQLHQGYDELREMNNKQEQKITRLESELKLIKSSRFWKLRNKTARLAGKPEIK